MLKIKQQKKNIYIIYCYLLLFSIQDIQRSVVTSVNQHVCKRSVCTIMCDSG